MNDLQLTVDHSNLTPSGTLSGHVAWTLDSIPRRGIKLSVFWSTEGTGDNDSECVEEIKIDCDNSTGYAPFSIQLPPEPYSFSGQLISLEWFVEAKAGRTVDAQKIIIAPDTVEVRL